MQNADEMAWDPSQWHFDVPINQSQLGVQLLDVPADTEFVVEPVSRLVPYPVNWEPFLPPLTASPDTQSDFVLPTDQLTPPLETQQTSMQAGQFASCPTSQNLAKWNALNEMSKERDPLLEKFMMNKNVISAGSSSCNDSTAASSVDGEAVRELLLPKGMFEDTPQNSERDLSPSQMQPQTFEVHAHKSGHDGFNVLDTNKDVQVESDGWKAMCEALNMPDHAYPSNVPDDICYALDDQMDQSGTLQINLTYSLGMWSIGSAKHATGDCKPCGFLWKKGCHKAQNCHFCHLCGSDEVKKRKRDKIATRRREELDGMWERREDDQPMPEELWECGDDEKPMPQETPRVLPGLPRY
jgi:rRNA maturation endonuclease Nob1